MLPYQTLAFAIHGKNRKKAYKSNKSKNIYCNMEQKI